MRASTQLEVLRLDEAVFRGLIARNHEIREYLELDMRLRYLRAFFRVHTPFARLPRGGAGVPAPRGGAGVVRRRARW